MGRWSATRRARMRRFPYGLFDVTDAVDVVNVRVLHTRRDAVVALPEVGDAGD